MIFLVLLSWALLVAFAVYLFLDIVVDPYVKRAIHRHYQKKIDELTFDLQEEDRREAEKRWP